MLAQLIFWLGVALICTHELDAIQHHEWRLFAFLRPFGDEIAYRIFTLAHVPLFLWFFWMAPHPARWFEIGIDLFLIIHVGLHFFFRRHPLYEFKGWLSHGLIAGAGLAGLVHLLLIWQ